MSPEDLQPRLLDQPADQAEPVAGNKTPGLSARCAPGELPDGLLRDALDTLPALIAFIDVNGRYAFMNRAYEEWFGIPAGDAVGRRVEDVVGETACRRSLENQRRALSGESTLHSNLLTRSDGEQRTVEVRFVPHRSASGAVDGYYVLSVDVTEREIEQRSLELTKFSIDNSVDIVLWIDREGKLQYANEMACSTLGYGDREISALKLFDVVTDVTEEQWPEVWKRNFERRQTNFITEHVTKDGRFFPAEVTAYFIELNGQRMICSFSRDITSRRRSEEELRISEERLRKLVDLSFDSIVEIKDGKIANINEIGARSYGYSREEMISQDAINMIAPEQREWVAGLIENGDSGNFETVHVRKNGTKFPVEVSARAFRTGDDLCRISAVRDISGRKAEEQALEEAMTAAENANRAKSDFLATMSHEIRTPLNAVIGMAGVVLGTDLTESQRENIEIIRESGGNLLNIINDILDLSKLEANRIELEAVTFGLDDMVSGVTDLLAPNAVQKGVALEVAIEGCYPAQLVGDCGRLRQVLLNLVSNAIKFTDDGHIKIAIRPVASDDGWLTVEFAVTDTGIGISEGKQAGIFTPFFQEDASISREYGGTGLGLSICKKLVMLMKGDIGFQSTLGVGSSFWFSVPLSCAADTAEGRSSEARPAGDLALDGAAETQSLRILVADDNRVNQLVLVAMLRSAGYDQVDVVANGTEAVAAVRSFPYDVVLMDTDMPLMDGLAATTEIRNLPGDRSAVPIIAVTANATVGDRDRFLAAGMDDILTKPIRAEVLLEKICSGIDSGANG